jgi:hypothetical protein
MISGVEFYLDSMASLPVLYKAQEAMPLPKKSSDSHSDTRWNLMFRELGRIVALPSSDHPAARIWKHSDLQSVIADIRKSHVTELKTTFPAAKKIIARMLAMRWLQPVPLQGTDSSEPSAIYLVDMEAVDEDMPEPLELLQGFKPQGVLCYFGALAFHELTTQQPAFYHIATLEKPSPGGDSATPTTAGHSGPQRAKRDPLGQFEFHYQDVPCYTTRRDKSLVPGVQSRDHGTRIRLRITTLEQTLLDTLIQPLRCGGESVAIEAWERGVRRWNPDRIARHLEAIDRADLYRRTGAMLDLIGESVPQGPLTSALAAAKHELSQAPEAELIPLLPGLATSHALPAWGIGPS